MGHKRILGKTTDFITGREITDTDDERYRQKLARFLVEVKGYEKDDVLPKRRIEMEIEGRRALSMVDFVVSVSGRPFMVIKYGPGSLVTRERPALAAARIMAGCEAPLTVVTNGEDAEVLDTVSGALLSTGIDSIPGRPAAEEMVRKTAGRPPLSAKQIEAEKRILSAYDYLEHDLECDADWCEPGAE
ncbi:MAG: type I restriction enzyme HsdR N-terminal domain-containing protein [Nitrospiraceae bacterium]|nr:type I restriction enzyme HsdR N-terminal domain-containing protein [Nitrospiraceae bacterium]